jgi:ribosomal protein S1
MNEASNPTSSDMSQQTAEPEVDSAKPDAANEKDLEGHAQPKAEGPENDTTAQSEADAAAQREADAAAKVLIGSQRDVSNKALSPSVPKQVQQAQTTAAFVGQQAESDQQTDDGPQIRSTAGLSDNIEKEIEEMLAGTSMDSVMGNNDSLETELAIDSRVKGTIIKIHHENVIFSLKGQFEGVVPIRQFKKEPVVGAMLEVIVTGYNEDDQLYELAIPGAAVNVEDWSDLTEGAIVDVKVTGSNTGGLECMVNNIRGFIPASQVELYRVEQFGEYVNQKLQCTITEVNPKRKKLVLSRRALLEREREESRKELLKSIQVGETRQGTVTKLMDFGALVDIGGIEGLVHISKMSWDRVQHPKEILEEGQSIKVKVEKVTEGSGRISLSYRDTLEHPWDNIEKKYPVNSIVKGKVSRIAQFGAFVKLEPGIEGLIHISELAHYRVFAVKNVVNEGDEVEVKLLSIDRDAQKMGLSLKATQAVPEKAAKQEENEPDEPTRELAVKKQSAELKGGRDRPSGGEEVGLNW